MPADGDRVLVCKDCSREFVLAAGEAAFFAARGLTEPKRCVACRRARAAQQQAREQEHIQGGQLR